MKQFTVHSAPYKTGKERHRRSICRFLVSSPEEVKSDLNTGNPTLLCCWEGQQGDCPGGLSCWRRDSVLLIRWSALVSCWSSAAHTATVQIDRCCPAMLNTRPEPLVCPLCFHHQYQKIGHDPKIGENQKWKFSFFLSKTCIVNKLGHFCSHLLSD